MLENRVSLAVYKEYRADCDKKLGDMNYEVCNLLSTMKLVNANMKSVDLLKERFSSNEERI